MRNIPGLAFLACLLATTPAFACSCVKTSRGEIIAGSQSVFRGKVRAISRSHDGLSEGATVLVTHRIKGAAPDRVLAITSRAPGMCGYSMLPDRDYDFAGAIDDRGRIHVDGCIMAPLNGSLPAD